VGGLAKSLSVSDCWSSLAPQIIPLFPTDPAVAPLAVDAPRLLSLGNVSFSCAGNVRELQNFIERSVILSLRSYLRGEGIRAGHAGTGGELAHPEGLKVGGPNGAAVRLGLRRTTLIQFPGPLR
jgi:hypothetical protein